MKQLLISILSFFCASILSYAQSEFIIYDCAPGTRIYRQDIKKWDSLHKNEVVNLTSLLNTKTKGDVKILDKRTSIIYCSVNTGTQKVSAIIESSAKRANSTIKNLNRQIVQNVKGTSHQNRKISVYGATVRGEDGLNQLDSLYYSIYHGVLKSDLSHVLSTQRVYISEELFYLSITNNTSTEYYISLLYGNKDSVSTCLHEYIYVDDIIALAPNTTIELEEIVFAKENEGLSYYVVVSTTPFSLIPIESALKYMTPPEYELSEVLVQTIPLK